VCHASPYNQAKNISKDLKDIFSLHMDIDLKPEKGYIQKMRVGVDLIK
jgi:hypothetical protein